MNTSKPATQSLTIQALIVTGVVVLYQLFGPYFGLPMVPDFVYTALEGAGLLVAGYGRVRATERIGSGE